MWDKISAGWCKTMHNRATWPIHGRYQCLECGRQYAVLWTESGRPEPKAEAVRPVHQPVTHAGWVSPAYYREAIRATLATMKQYFRSAIT
jgi:hypothetical protein